MRTLRKLSEKKNKESKIKEVNERGEKSARISLKLVCVKNKRHD